MDEQKKNLEKKMKKQMQKIKRKNDGFWADFKKFIMKGNVLDLAVAVVIANAFNAIVNGLVKYIITPLITFATSGVSIDEWEWVIREAVVDENNVETVSKISVQYGLWLQAIVNFLIIAFCIFVTVRILKKAERALKTKEIEKQEAEAAKKKEEEAKAAEAAKALAEKKKATEEEFYTNVKEQSELLRQIRDSLKK